MNVDALALRGTEVSRNTIRAIGRRGEAAGGGIWNSRVPDFTLAAHPRRQRDHRQCDHRRAGIDVHGGGLFTSDPITLTRTRIRGNRPDQCAGC